MLESLFNKIEVTPLVAAFDSGANYASSLG